MCLARAPGRARATRAGIPEVITHVDAVVTGIASTAEEHASRSKETAATIAQAAASIQEVTHNVTQAAEVSRQIAADILTVHTMVEKFHL